MDVNNLHFNVYVLLQLLDTEGWNRGEYFRVIWKLVTDLISGIVCV